MPIRWYPDEWPARDLPAEERELRLGRLHDVLAETLGKFRCPCCGIPVDVVARGTAEGRS